MKKIQIVVAIAVMVVFCIIGSAAFAQKDNGQQVTQSTSDVVNPKFILGNDEKMVFDNDGKPIHLAPGRDTISIISIGTNPESPKIIASLPLQTSMIGPPVNLAITPNEELALAVNSSKVVQQSGKWQPVPDNKLYVINLKANPPIHIATLEVGMRPTGVAINARGDMALVGSREGKSVSVLSIRGDEVKLIDTVPIEEEVGAVAFTPDGKRALVAKLPAHKIAVLDIDGQKVTYNKALDMPVGLWPYNVDVTPDGKIALTANLGLDGTSDGHIDTVSVIDLEVNPPHVVDHIAVGDGPDGMTISPTGEIAVVVLLRGSNKKSVWYYNRNSSVVVLKIDNKHVTKISEVEVGGLAEGVAFSPDGKYLYVSNFLDRNVSILKVNGTTVTNTGKQLQLPGHPTAMRGK